MIRRATVTALLVLAAALLLLTLALLTLALLAGVQLVVALGRRREA